MQAGEKAEIIADSHCPLPFLWLLSLRTYRATSARYTQTQPPLSLSPPHSSLLSFLPFLLRGFFSEPASSFVAPLEARAARLQGETTAMAMADKGGEAAELPPDIHGLGETRISSRSVTCSPASVIVCCCKYSFTFHDDGVKGEKGAGGRRICMQL